MGPRNGSHSSSGRAAGALNHWASSALLGILLCFILALFYLFITLKNSLGLSLWMIESRYFFLTWNGQPIVSIHGLNIHQLHLFEMIYFYFFYFLAMAASNTHTSLSQALHSVPVIVAWSMCLNPYATLVYIDEHELPCCQKGKSPSILLSSHCFAL